MERFRDQYLESLKFEQRATVDKPGLMPRVGDVVIVFDKEHRLSWSKGLILELVKSQDGNVRKAKVRINKVESIKAINHLYPLEARVEEEIERYRRDKGLHKFQYKNLEPDAQNTQEKNQERIMSLRSNSAKKKRV